MSLIKYLHRNNITLLQGCKFILATFISYQTVIPSSCKMAAAINDENNDNSDAICKRLQDVPGYIDRKNDLIFCGTKSKYPEQNVVFFGGDVQDYSENMLAHRDNKIYEKWNLDSTAQLLHKRFPNSHIWVVKPSAMTLKTFSVYSNFVTSTSIGNPEHGPSQGSWFHLHDLLMNGVAQVNGKSLPSETCAREESALCSSSNINLPLTIIGFSKGCVVLNQLLYEMEEAKENTELTNFIKQVKHMYWLDGGHNGGSKVWIVDEKVLQALQDTGINVHCHVTPYQMNDAMRPWIVKEHKKFVEKLKKLNITVTKKLHFSDEERSIDIHFRVLEQF